MAVGNIKTHTLRSLLSALSRSSIIVVISQAVATVWEDGLQNIKAIQFCRKKFSKIGMLTRAVLRLVWPFDGIVQKNMHKRLI